ncbi:MAG: DUF3568 family protein [Nitrospirae bacterium]|nr:DUF3568 family protein [Nitrospirota bacterium]
MKSILKKIYPAMLAIFLLSGSYGCAVVVAGAAGAGAAYSLTADSVSGNIDASKRAAFDNFKKIVIEEGGKIISSNYTDGNIRAKLNGRDIYFSVKKLTENAVNIKIRARKGYQLLPDGDEALRLYKKLTARL